MKAIVISGGGAKGAWGGGVTEYLHKDLNKKWDIFLGSSTGSLISANLPKYDFDELKQMYTSVNNDSIFSVNPFKDNGKIKFFNLVWRLIKKKKSIGEFGNLRKLLKESCTIQDFLNIKSSNEIIITTSNMTTGSPEFFSNKDYTHANLGPRYDRFIDAIIASASVPLAAEPVKIDNDYYLDGGILEHAPIQKAIEMGASEIDIIMLRTEKSKNTEWSPKNMFDVLLRTIDLLQREVSLSDVMIATLLADLKKDVQLNFYYTPTELSRNALTFDKEEMLKWWESGRNEFKTKKAKSILLTKKGKRIQL